MTTPVHRYVVTDLITDRPIGWIPAAGVTYSRFIGKVGEFTGSFPITSQRLGTIARTLNDRPCGLYAYRGRQVWWGGIVWQAPVKKAKRGQASRCSIAAQTFDSLPTRRRIFTDYDLAPADRGAALATLWARMQDPAVHGPTATILLDPGAPTVGGDQFDASYAGTDATTYATAMRQITDLDPKVETTIDVWADEQNIRHRALRVGAPLVGNLAPTSTWRPSLLVTPSNLVGLDDIGDHTTRPTHILGRGLAEDLGGGATEPTTTGVLADADAVANGAPRVDGVYDATTDDPTRLLTETTQQLGGPNRIPQLWVRLPENSTFQPGQIGDIASAQVVDPLFAGGQLRTTRRLIGVEVEPAERGRSERVGFTFHDPYVVGAA